jgi:hypothetical protein
MENIRKWIYCKPIYGGRVEKITGSRRPAAGVHQLSQKKE